MSPPHSMAKRILLLSPEVELTYLDKITASGLDIIKLRFKSVLPIAFAPPTQTASRGIFEIISLISTSLL